mmetsp:Transcript_66431/g.179611  ORF Transcript_66431/g.179611 Transcript_66431/m.179611 type:complete len:228 (-) Transcript_66431:38-721(-)
MGPFRNFHSYEYSSSSSLVTSPRKAACSSRFLLYAVSHVVEMNESRNEEWTTPVLLCHVPPWPAHVDSVAIMCSLAGSFTSGHAPRSCAAVLPLLGVVTFSLASPGSPAAAAVAAALALGASGAVALSCRAAGKSGAGGPLSRSTWSILHCGTARPPALPCSAAARPPDAAPAAAAAAARAKARGQTRRSTTTSGSISGRRGPRGRRAPGRWPGASKYATRVRGLRQ